MKGEWNQITKTQREEKKTERSSFDTAKCSFDGNEIVWYEKDFQWNAEKGASANFYDLFVVAVVV